MSRYADGSTLEITIKEVKYDPNLCTNLFSINKATKNGFNLCNKGTSICLTKGSSSITFDRVDKTLLGTISGNKMVPNDSSAAYAAHGIQDLTKNKDINKFHEIIGYYGFDHLKKTADIHGLKLKVN